MTYLETPNKDLYLFAIIAIAVVVLATIISMITYAIKKKTNRMIESETNRVKAALMCCAYGRDCDKCPLNPYQNCKDVLITEANILVRDQEKLIRKYGMILLGKGTRQ
jgi:hypothetical protein